MNIKDFKNCFKIIVRLSNKLIFYDVQINKVISFVC